ncbi:MAG: hypothetical protein AB1567_13310, partial [bacterium]
RRCINMSELRQRMIEDLQLADLKSEVVNTNLCSGTKRKETACDLEQRRSPTDTEEYPTDEVSCLPSNYLFLWTAITWSVVNFFMIPFT